MINDYGVGVPIGVIGARARAVPEISRFSAATRRARLRSRLRVRESRATMRDDDGGFAFSRSRRRRRRAPGTKLVVVVVQEQVHSVGSRGEMNEIVSRYDTYGRRGGTVLSGPAISRARARARRGAERARAQLRVA